MEARHSYTINQLTENKVKKGKADDSCSHSALGSFCALAKHGDREARPPLRIGMTGRRLGQSAAVLLISPSESHLKLASWIKFNTHPCIMPSPLCVCVCMCSSPSCHPPHFLSLFFFFSFSLFLSPSVSCSLCYSALLGRTAQSRMWL